MSTKNQQKQRHGKKADDEIIEIEDISNCRQTRLSQKRKELPENTSSEATTPNKKKKIRRKNEDTELIEIMDIESPELPMVPNKKKASSPVLRSKKSEVKISANEKVKKKEKMSVKSVSKIGKEKSPFHRKKKEVKVASITLEESDNDSDMEITEIKGGSAKKKSTTKTFERKSTNKNKSNVNTNNQNKNKKNEKKGKNEKKSDIVQYNLSDEESDNENKKGKAQKKQYQYQKKNRCSRTEKSSGYLTTRKLSKSALNTLEDKDKTTIKSKSTIKVFRKEKELKDTLNDLLGKKRKLNSNSKTPNKKTPKTTTVQEREKQKSQVQPKIQNEAKISVQISTEKAKSPNCNKRAPQINNKSNSSDLSNKMDIDGLNSNNRFSTPECAILNQLIIEYGFEKVLDSLCKPKLDQKNKLDSCLQGLKDSCTKDKLPFLLMKMFFSYFESKFDPNHTQKHKRSTSVNSSTTLNILEDISKPHMPTSKSQLKENKIDNSKKEKIGNITPIEIDDEEIEEVKDKDKEKDKDINKNNERKPFASKSLNINNNVSATSSNVKSVSKQEVKRGEKKATSIGSHYNKTTDGEIFKYQVSNLDGKGNAVFKCYDENCTGVGIYEIESKKFTVTKKHSLKHAEHEYVINMEKEKDNIFQELKTTGKCDAQVFKENGERTVKMY